MSEFVLFMISPPVMLVTHVWAFTPIGWAFNLVLACVLANWWESRVDGQLAGTAIQEKVDE